LWRAFPGDPFFIRIEGGGTNRLHPLSLHGHHWRYEWNNPNSTRRDFILTGISEGFPSKE